MPTAEELKQQQEAAKALAKELDDILFVNRDITAEISRQTSATEGLFGKKSRESKLMTSIERQAGNISRVLEKQISLVKSIGDGKVKEIDLLKEIQKNEHIIKDLKTKQVQQVADLTAAQTELAQKQLEEQKAQLSFQEALANGTIQEGKKAKEALETALEATKLEQDRVNQLQKNIEVTDRLVENYIAGNDELKKGIALFQQQNKEAKKVSDTIVKSIFSAISLGIGINSIWEAFKKLNSQTTATAQQLGISVEQTNKIGKSLNNVAGQFSNSTFAISTLLKGLQELNAELGTSLQFSEQEVVQFTELTKTIGLSATEATKLFAIGKLNNQTLKQTEQAIIDGVVASNKQFKIQVSARDVFKDISKLSAGILVKFQQNPEALAKAVVQAKSLGTTLDQVDKIGESLLNFEQSIQSELEAELLTGKALNLERARAAALTGDQVTLMNEIASQTGNLAEYQKMNIIQQNTLAKAFGLSRDELSQMLVDQAKFAALGDVSKESAAKQLEYAKANGITLEESVMKSLEQQAAADRIDQTFGKLKETLASIVEGPLFQFIESTAKLLNNTTVLSTILGVAIAGSVLKAIQGFGQMLMLSEKLLAVEKATALTKAVGTALSNPLLLIGGLALAGAATAAVMSASKVDDFATDGESVIKSPMGTFITDKKDQIVAAPGAADALRAPAARQDNSDVIAAINKLNERPIMVQTKFNTDTILRLSTNQGQYGATGTFA